MLSNQLKTAVLLLSLLCSHFVAAAVVTSYDAIPPTINDSADPNIMIALSNDESMQGAAYNDADDTASGGSCTGRPTNDVGTCYFPTKEYIGYFDPNKCYTYNAAAFRYEPAAATGADHTCSGQWSGNLLNWATMTAADEIRWALTGGNRVGDTAGAGAVTVLARAYLFLAMPSGPFPDKKISAADNVSPSTVTPYSDTTIWIRNVGPGMYVGTTQGSYDRAANYVRVRVCDPTVSVEANCNAYSDGTNTWYKPEGLIQDGALRMRFAVMSYLNDTSETRHGGVLRANMKYTGPYRPTASGGIEVNPNKEWDTNGVQLNYNDPDGLAALDADISYSGVINYINNFGNFGNFGSYKRHDPIGEMYYECLNYFKKRGPTSDYSATITATMKGNFPVINGSSYGSTTISGNNNWIDPFIHRCQNNYIIGISDSNPWLDKKLPGTSYTTNGTLTSLGVSDTNKDYGTPSNADPAINVTTLTNTVGDLQGITGTIQCVGTEGITAFNGSSQNLSIAELAKVIGTCPYPNQMNSYYLAGLAYYARTNDLRSDLTDDQTVETFMVDVQEYANSPVTDQMNVLWLAGKFGGFTEQDNSDTNGDGNSNEPNLTAEWDENGDGIPDNYAFASEPVKLVNGLQRAFTNIEKRVSAGSAAAVISDTVAMTGAVIQALYQPATFIDGSAATWTGILHSIFIDEKGNLREDTNGNATLDSTDEWVRILYNESVGRTQVHYCNKADNCATYTATREIEDLKPVWNARNQLANISTAQITTQRAYTTSFGSSSGGGRHIFTWLDNGDNAVTASEVVDFTAGSFDSSNYGYLNAADATEAGNIVDFIRGKEGISGFRSRSVDYDGDGNREAWRLADIVHSTPVIVSRPSGQYYSLYGDDTYLDFVTQYRDRRSVVYVGANDGMLHAFNAGFFKPEAKKFCLDNACTAGLTADTAHPLGAELWAYVPKNLLPHLRWLTEPDYPHVYYMDGKPQAFDVNIFPDDTDHPGGWGTILVAGMRLGGGSLDVDYNKDGTVDYTAKSAYVILDITNPENPPVLLGEFTDADLGFTTSTPDIAVRRQSDANLDWSAAGTGTYPNDWYLVFGAGPTDLDTATSTRNAKVYAVKLTLNSSTGRLDLNTAGLITKVDTGITNSFVGDPATIDWSRDFQTDAIYFGIVGGTPASPNGQLMRIALTSNSPSDWASAGNRGTLINPGQPFPHKPELYSKDSYPNNEWWIFAGTGRLYVKADNISTTRQSMYGIRDIHSTSAPQSLPDVNASVSTSTSATYPLQNVTGVQVFADASVAIPSALSTQFPAGTDTFNELESFVKSKQGWYFDFGYDGTSPATRTLTKATYWQQLALFTSYTPPLDTCVAEGFSDIYAVYYQTGTAHWDAVGLDASSTTSFNGAGYPEKLPKMGLSYGIASEITLYQTVDGAKPVIQMSTGEIVERDAIKGITSGSGRQSWREIPLN